MAEKIGRVHRKWVEQEDHQDIWAREKIGFLGYVLDIPTLILLIDGWRCTQVCGVWLTLLWNILWWSAETAEIRQGYYDAESLQQLFQQIAVT